VAVTYRGLGPGDEGVLRALSVEAARFDYAGSEPRYEPLSNAGAASFLAEARNYLDVAFDGDRPVGMLLAYELDRRHGDRRMLFIYELGVDRDHRRRGIGRALLHRVRAHARERGISHGFVITDERNEAALALYRSVGATRERDDDVVLDLGFGAEA
jgi:aminoglycoside 3-N-acetyltransferase I